MNATGWKFSDPELVGRLRDELDGWRGTPFFPFMATKGVGVDCIRFAAAVFEGLGLIQPVVWPRYAIRGSGNESLELLDNSVMSFEGAVVRWRRDWGLPMPALDDLLAGDVFLFSNRMSFHHLAVYAGDGVFFHALHHFGVTTGLVGDNHFKTYLFAVFRLSTNPNALS